MAESDSPIDSIEAVLPCADLDAALAFFLDELGFRLDRIFPADAPRTAIVSLNGFCVRLETGRDSGSPKLRLLSDDAQFVQRALAGSFLPDDLPLDFALKAPSLDMPPLRSMLVVEQGGDTAEWGTGRAGMQYRDLVPGRVGGRFIASHIRIPVGGPVPDYVHHHHVRFQMIYCYRGWVRVVYEDQGEPFVMRAGDCVLQPPHIRHRVLECSDAFEVVEIGCPAEHETLVDHDMPLPNDTVDTDREYSGQSFVFHQAANADFLRSRDDGFEAQDTGIAKATHGEASVAVIRPAADFLSRFSAHDAEFLFRFVLQGSVDLETANGEPMSLRATDAFVVPAGLPAALRNPSDDLQMLEVALPADYQAEKTEDD